MGDHAEVTVGRNRQGAYQADLSVVDEKGYGSGYRLAGGKYDGGGETLTRHRLDQRDADEIRRLLDAAFPPAHAPVTVDEETRKALSDGIIRIDGAGDDGEHWHFIVQAPEGMGLHAAMNMLRNALDAKPFPHLGGTFPCGAADLEMPHEPHRYVLFSGEATADCRGWPIEGT